MSIGAASAGDKKLIGDDLFPITSAVLNSAYKSEKLAYLHYVGYSKKAIDEKYLNLAYLFSAFAVSEKIHAENYKKTLTTLNAKIEEPEAKILISGTKKNLTSAAENELIKIKKTYRAYLEKLEKESHEQAVINCMYSWKSHRQHRKKVVEIRKYAKQFFGAVAKKIEAMRFDIYVCEICGSTIDEMPETPCEICNRPMLHYHKVTRPT